MAISVPRCRNVSPSLWAGGGLKRRACGVHVSRPLVSPSLWAGGGLKQPAAFSDHGLCSVSPSLWAGGGLKRRCGVFYLDRDPGFPQPLGWGRIETRSYPRYGSRGLARFPQPLGWGRIETASAVRIPGRERVSPSLWAGGGLKRRLPRRTSKVGSVSPSLWAGGGLKLGTNVGYTLAAAVVSPSLWAGGGLKLHTVAGDGRPQEVSPSLWAGGGLKRLLARAPGRLSS